jgi:tetratricopeptide (TPR) repeat protein
LLRDWLQIGEGAASETILRSITSSRNGASTEDARALLALLDSTWSDNAWEVLEPETRRRMMIQAAVRFVQFEAERSPVVIELEDLHWIDAGTIEFIRCLAADLEGRAILLLCTARPELALEKFEALLEEIPIDSLSQEESTSLLDQLLGTSADLKEFKVGLIGKSAGTPLFLEEVVQSLIERAVLVKDGEDYRLTSSTSDLAVPATVQAVIAARIDNVPDQPLELLQKAAIIGAEGPRDLLQKIALLEYSEFNRRLAVLEDRGLLRLSGEKFTFKHVLTREVVYESILSETRQATHLDVVSSIEQQSSQLHSENVEALARHSLAGLDWRRAAKYFRAAAERATEFSAFHESVRHLRVVLNSLEKLGTSNEVLVDTIDTLLSLRRALFAIGDLTPILGHLTKAAEIAERIGDEARLAATSIFTSNLYSHQGRLHEAVETGLRALGIARGLGDSNLIVSASIVLSLAYEFWGRSHDVVVTLGPIAATVDADMDHPHFATSASYSVQCLAILAGASASLGRFEDAEQQATRALELARKRGRPYDVGLATYYLALVQLRRAKLNETIAVVSGGIRDEMGFVIPWLHSELGYAYALRGNATEAMSLLEEVHERCLAIGLDFLAVRTMGWLALANFRLGNTATAERLSASALTSARFRNYLELEAWLLRFRALLRVNRTQQDLADAVMMVQSALKISGQLGLELERTHCTRVLAELTDDDEQAICTAHDAYERMGIATSDAEPNLILAIARQHRD